MVWNMIFSPLDSLDPRLRQECASLNKADLRVREQQLEIDGLLDFVYGVVNKATPGVKPDRGRPTTVGLSANQVGVIKQISIVDLSIGKRGYTDVHVLINPRIVWKSKSQIEKPEGCVNFDNTWGITRRSRAVQVAAWDRSGNEIMLKLSGWPAILLQHEIDHLQGYLFIDRLIDPAKAHLVADDDYPLYRKTKPADWRKFVDVTAQVRH